MSFYLGQQLVCIDDQFDQNPYWRQTIQAFPKFNSVYTIRIIRLGAEYGLSPFIAFCFYELVNLPALFPIGSPSKLGLFEPSFLSKYFRPVQKTNIDIFKKLLASGPAQRDCSNPRLVEAV